MLGVLAEAQRDAGSPSAALQTVEAALSLSAQGDQSYWDAELHRLKGELLLIVEPGSEPEAERRFHHALEIARGQEARSLELRAAASLARLLRRQGRPGDPCTLLRPLHAWFTEGFDTPDLMEANALLNAL
jgi:predicted ATPase